MIVKKYRLNLGDRNIRDSNGNWLTEKEKRGSSGGCFSVWCNDKEYFTLGSLVYHFETFFHTSFPIDFEEKIEKLEYDIPEGEFVITRCNPSWEYSEYRPNRSLFRYCKSVQEVLDYLDDYMETFRIVQGQFKLERPLTTLYVTDLYTNARCWKYTGT